MLDQDLIIRRDDRMGVAWYADRPALWLPARNERIGKLRAQFSTARWLLLTEQVRGHSPEWQMLHGQMQQWNVQYFRTPRETAPCRVRWGQGLP